MGVKSGRIKRQEIEKRSSHALTLEPVIEERDATGGGEVRAHRDRRSPGIVRAEPECLVFAGKLAHFARIKELVKEKELNQRRKPVF